MKLSSRISLSVRDIWARSSGVMRFMLYLAFVDLFLYLLQRLFRLFKWDAMADTLRPWLISLAIICIALLLFIFARWFRRKIMWRLRNRLIVTYVFIGVIPVILLLALGLVAVKLLAGQFATYLASSDLQHRIDTLDTSTSTLANALAHRVRQGSDISSFVGLRPSRRFPHRQITVWYKGHPTLLGEAGSEPTQRPTPLPPGGNDFRALVDEDGHVFLRASRSASVGNENLTVVSNVPLDDDLLRDITPDLGQVLLAGTNLRAGELPPPGNRIDIVIDFAIPLELIDWKTGKVASAPYLYVGTRPSLLFNRLFSNLGTNAGAILVVLFVISVLLGLIELVALIIGVRLTRTMTNSVYELYRATEHINHGDFAYRIPVTGHDQMAELETSFNSMSHSLEGLIAEQKEKQRMESELAIAHEVQEQLFPRDLGNLKSLELHGVCRPARSVSGDYYDFLPLGSEKMGIAVADISGKGISAALLMANIHSAVRVYEMGRVPIREQLAAAGGGISLASVSMPLMPAVVAQSPSTILGLLNRHLFHSTPSEKYATMFFGIWNGQERTLTYSNAGHLPPFIVRQNGTIEELTVGGTVIGLFDDVVYEEASVKLAPGEIFVAYSDGLTEPENEFGEFGSARLIELIRKSRTMPLVRICELVTTSVIDWIGAAEQPDDVTLVLAKAK